MSRPFIPVANTASVEFIYSLNSQVTAENVIHIQKGSSYSFADLQAVRALCITWFSTYYKARLSTSTTLVRIRSKALDTQNSPLEDYYLPAPIAGTDASSYAAPNNVSYCVKVASGLAGRSARGRWYTCGNAASKIAAGSVDVTWANSVVSNLNQLKTDLAGAGHTLVITSLRANKAWRANGVNFVATGFVAVDYYADSQRRRLIGRGRT